MQIIADLKSDFRYNDRVTEMAGQSSGRNTDINKRRFSRLLHELLIQELDFEDATINKFIDAVALNIILKSLTQEKRIQFYGLIHEGKQQAAEEFIRTEIPDINEQVLKMVKDEFEEIL